MIYFILFLFVVGFIVYMSSRHKISNELRTSLSPYEIEMIDEELKNILVNGLIETEGFVNTLTKIENRERNLEELL